MIRNGGEDNQRLSGNIRKGKDFFKKRKNALDKSAAGKRVFYFGKVKFFKVSQFHYFTSCPATGHHSPPLDGLISVLSCPLCPIILVRKIKAFPLATLTRPRPCFRLFFD